MALYYDTDLEPGDEDADRVGPQRRAAACTTGTWPASRRASITSTRSSPTRTGSSQGRYSTGPVRVSATIPAATDGNGNGLADAWETQVRRVEPERGRRRRRRPQPGRVPGRDAPAPVEHLDAAGRRDRLLRRAHRAGQPGFDAGRRHAHLPAAGAEHADHPELLAAAVRPHHRRRQRDRRPEPGRRLDGDHRQHRRRGRRAHDVLGRPVLRRPHRQGDRAHRHHVVPGRGRRQQLLHDLRAAGQPGQHAGDRDGDVPARAVGHVHQELQRAGELARDHLHERGPGRRRRPAAERPVVLDAGDEHRADRGRAVDVLHQLARLERRARGRGGARRRGPAGTSPRARPAASSARSCCSPTPTRRRPPRRSATCCRAARS